MQVAQGKSPAIKHLISVIPTYPPLSHSFVSPAADLRSGERGSAGGAGPGMHGITPGCAVCPESHLCHPLTTDSECDLGQVP